MLINQKYVRDYALKCAYDLQNAGLAAGSTATAKPIKTRVSLDFMTHVDAMLRKAISERVRHHDNKTGNRMTLQ